MNAELDLLLKRINGAADVAFIKERGASLIVDECGWTAEVYQVKRNAESIRWSAFGDTAHEAATKLITRLWGEAQVASQQGTKE